MNICLLFLLIPKLAIGCKIVISELNLMEIIKPSAFIELTTHNCSRTHPPPQLSKHGLILLKSKGEENSEIILTIDLIQRKIPPTRYFVISKEVRIGPDEYGTDLMLAEKGPGSASAGWAYELDVQQERSGLASWLLPQSSSAAASLAAATGNPAYLLILFEIDRTKPDEVQTWDEMRLAKTVTKNTIRQNTPIQFKDEFADFLADRLVDALLLAKNDNPIVAKSYLRIFKNDRTKYLAQRIYTQNTDRKLSINRCDSDGNFLSESSPKMGIPTPGAPNDCTGISLEICDTAEGRREEACGGALTANERMANVAMEVDENEDEEEEDEEQDLELNDELEVDEYRAATEIQPQLDRMESMMEAILKASQRFCQTEPPLPKKFRSEQCDLTDLPTVVRNMIEEIKAQKKPWEKKIEWPIEMVAILKDKQKMIYGKRSYIQKRKWAELVVRQDGLIGLQCRFCYEDRLNRYIAAKGKEIDRIEAADIDAWGGVPLDSFSKAEGFMTDNWKKLKDKLSEHELRRSQGKSKGEGRMDVARRHASRHSHIMLKIQQDFVKEQKRKISNLIKATEEDATSRMIRLVYLQAKLNFPLFHHRQLVEYVSDMGIDMGSHHRHRKSATQMLETISNVMHRKLIDYIKNMNVPISLILDTSTDTNGNNYLVVQFRTIIKDYPVVYLYKLLKLANETSEGMFQTMMSHFVKDNILENLKEKLIGMGTDGASVMRAEGGLFGKFKNFITHNHNFVPIHCMAHRLQLSFIHGLRSVPEIERVENHFHEIITFFTNKGVKRRNALIELAQTRNEKFIELKPFFRVRWTESEAETVTSIIRNYQLLHEFFSHVANDKDNFNIDVRQQAAFYFKSFSHAGFYAFLSFFSDVLTILTKSSKHYQLQGGVLIGQHSRTKNLTDELNSLKNDDGPAMRKFLNNVYCQKATGGGFNKCSRENVLAPRSPATAIINRMYMKYGQNEYMAEFAADVNGDIFANTEVPLNLRPQRRQADQPMILGVPLNNIDFPIFNDDIRDRIIDGVVGEIKSYFPNDCTELLEFMVPSNLPDNVASIVSYSGPLVQWEFMDIYFILEKIRPLAEYFKFDVDLVDDQFLNLLRLLIKNRKYNKRKALSPQSFWRWALTSDFEIGTELRNLLHHVLSLPIGSADAERAFSLLFHIRSKRRNRFTADHLQDNLRIRMNGPPFNELILYDYKKEWLEHHLSSDDPVPGRGKSKKNVNEEDEEEEDDDMNLDMDLEFEEDVDIDLYYNDDGLPITKRNEMAFFKEFERKFMYEIFN